MPETFDRITPIRPLRAATVGKVPRRLTDRPWNRKPKDTSDRPIYIKQPSGR